MTITVHADPCPTCHGSGVVADHEGSALDCAKCELLPGWRVPAWHKVPKVPDPHCVEAWPEHVTDAYHPSCCRFPKSCSAWPVLDPDWVPGASVTITAVCRECGGEGGDLTDFTPTRWVDCPCVADVIANPGDLYGARSVGELVIADPLMPVIGVPGGKNWPPPSGPHVQVCLQPPGFAYVNGDTWQRIDIVCVPGDTLAHLEKKPS